MAKKINLHKRLAMGENVTGKESPEDSKINKKNMRHGGVCSIKKENMKEGGKAK